jgi:hypothetical protein
VNLFGTRVISAFIGFLFIGYMLILRPSVQVSVSQEAVYALSGLVSAGAVRAVRLRRDRH